MADPLPLIATMPYDIRYAIWKRFVAGCSKEKSIRMLVQFVVDTCMAYQHVVYSQFSVAARWIDPMTYTRTLFIIHSGYQSMNRRWFLQTTKDFSNDQSFMSAVSLRNEWCSDDRHSFQCALLEAMFNMYDEMREPVHKPKVSFIIRNGMMNEDSQHIGVPDSPMYQHVQDIYV